MFKGRGKSGALDPLKLPTRLQTALQALYGHYEKTFKLWEERGIQVPPRFIIVCQNTAISKLVYDFVSGFHRPNEDGSTALENGRLALFRNFDETTGNQLPRPNTLLIDSEQLEAGDALDTGFRAMAADEIDRFRREITERTGDRRKAESRADLLHLLVEIKGYRREDAKEKKATMETYWVPGVNNLKTYGRWTFAEFNRMIDKMIRQDEQD